MAKPKSIVKHRRAKGKQKFRKWINDYSSASSWLEQYDLEQLLIEGDGIIKIKSFLPDFVAEGILSMLESIPEEAWNMTAASDDYTHNNIRHEFLSVKQLPELQAVFRLLTLLLPDSLWTFSAAKYGRLGHIVPHDDRAYTNVLMEDGSLQLCSRAVGLILYLTPSWQADWGGALVDHEAPGGPQVHVPAFNSLIAFTVPRWHEVTPVTVDRPRYSIFGWFLEPGELYELNTAPGPAPHATQLLLRQQQEEEEEQEEDGEKQQQQQQQALPAAKLKKDQHKKTKGSSSSQQPEAQQLAEAAGKQQQQQQPKKAKLKRKRQQEQQQQQQQQLAAHAAPQQQPAIAKQQLQQQPGVKKKKKHKRVAQAGAVPSLQQQQQQQQYSKQLLAPAAAGVAKRKKKKKKAKEVAQQLLA